MGEALERWDMDLLRSVVPEICDILLKIEERLQQEFARRESPRRLR